jgi:hypothetical protein
MGFIWAHNPSALEGIGEFETEYGETLDRAGVMVFLQDTIGEFEHLGEEFC